MNHPQKGIFTPVRNEPLTGRNANIQPTMFKRKQIFQKAPTERSQTPFSGYSFTGSSVSDNMSLARSQVSQVNQQQINRMMQEFVQKKGLGSLSENSQQSLRNKNQLNILRIQIRGIKESYHEFNKSFKKKIEDQNDTINELKKQLHIQTKENTLTRENMSAELVQKIQQVEQGIAVKMRLIFTKMQQDLRKELTNYANREFVPTSFLDDLDKQLNELDDRIANIQTEYEDNKSKGNKQNMTASKIDRDSSMILSSGSELKLKQFERDLINLKKEMDEKSDQIKEIDQAILIKHQSYSKQLKDIKQTVTDISSTIKEKDKQYDAFKCNLEAKIETDKKKLFQKLENDLEALSKKLDQELVLKSLALANNIEPENYKRKIQSTSILLENTQVENQSSKFQDTRDESKLSGLQSSTHKNSEIITNNQTHQRSSPSPNADKNLSPVGNEAFIINKDSPKKTKKITITYGASQKTLIQSPESQPRVGSGMIETSVNSVTIQSVPITKDQQEIKTLYKVDKDGYLMDINNKYLLSPSNSMIFVSEKQIEAMEKTNVIKVEKWTGS